MKYKVCSMLLAAALAFSLWPVSARADALENGGAVQEATGEPLSSDGELPDENVGKKGGLDAENSEAAGTAGEEEITAAGNQMDFPEEIVVAGTAETGEAEAAPFSPRVRIGVAPAAGVALTTTPRPNTLCCTTSPGRNCLLSDGDFLAVAPAPMLEVPNRLETPPAGAAGWCSPARRAPPCSSPQPASRTPQRDSPG